MTTEIKPLGPKCYRPSVRNREEIPVLAAKLGWSRNYTIEFCVNYAKRQLRKRIKAQTKNL